jgi:hypothetical protein
MIPEVIDVGGDLLRCDVSGSRLVSFEEGPAVQKLQKIAVMRRGLSRVTGLRCPARPPGLSRTAGWQAAAQALRSAWGHRSSGSNRNFPFASIFAIGPVA